MNIKIKNTVFLYIHSLRRDYLGNWLLLKELNKKNIKVILTSKNTLKRLIKIFSPEGIIVNNSIILDSQQIEKLNSRKVKIIILEQEGATNKMGIETTYPLRDKKNNFINYSNYSLILVWNTITKNWLKKNRPSLANKIHVCGNMRLDKSLNNCYQKSNKIIGILGRFEYLNTYDKRNILDHLTRFDPELKRDSTSLKNFSIEAEGFSLTSKFMRLVLENGFNISLRPHPNEDLETYKLIINKRFKKFKKQIKIDNSLSINEWLSEVFIVIGDISSSYEDIRNANKNIISFEAIKRYRMDEERAVNMKNFTKCAYLPKSLKDALKLIKSSNLDIKKSNAYNTFKSKLYGDIKTKNILNGIVDRITYLLEKKTKKRKKTISFSYYSVVIVAFLIDLLVILKNLFGNTNFNVLKRKIYYDYNRVLIRPSIYMKKLNS